VHDGHYNVLGEHRGDVRDEFRNEARMFSTAPPGTAARRPEQTAQECSARNFESPLWQDTALRSIPDFMRGQRRENGLVVRGPMASRLEFRHIPRIQRVSTSLLVSLQKMLTLTQSFPFHERNPSDDAD